MQKFSVWYSAVIIALGIGSAFLSRVWDVSFVRGFFQGAAVALIIMGIYLLVRTVMGRGDAEAGMWRPSQDRPHDG